MPYCRSRLIWLSCVIFQLTEANVEPNINGALSEQTEVVIVQGRWLSPQSIDHLEHTTSLSSQTRTKRLYEWMDVMSLNFVYSRRQKNYAYVLYIYVSIFDSSLARIAVSFFYLLFKKLGRGE